MEKQKFVWSLHVAEIFSAFAFFLSDSFVYYKWNVYM